MGRPKKDNDLVLGEVSEETKPETVENVTAEVVQDDAGVLAKKEIEKLKAELADKDKQLKSIGGSSLKVTRGKVKERLAGGSKKAGFITIYEMR